ncbi:MAG TPA: rod shape-determining protein RodA [Bacteroidales bacterium]|nr:rod shape-determining protein RodA [Bacteroidales bacterium]HRZ49509.1 rod shape-determining protein RodA [Bacteroidales bacterium]
MEKRISRGKGLFYNIDWTMVLLWLALVVAGWLNIYSSGNKEGVSEILDFSHRYGKQLLWIGFAVLLALLVLMVDPKVIPPLSFMIYLLTILLLVAVLVIGKEVNNSKSWFQIGGFALQPSEFAKMAISLALARAMSSLTFDIRSRNSQLLIIGIIGLPMALILMQPDMGSAIVLLSLVVMLYRFGMNQVLVATALFILLLALLSFIVSKIILAIILAFMAGIIIFFLRGKTKEIILVSSVAIIAIGFVFAVDFIYHKGLKPHQKQRIEVYVSNLKGVDKDIRDVGYNFYQSKVAIGSGGFFGKGYLQGTQTKMNFIPEQDTDFIFCTVGEEWGFLGSLVVISLYLLLIIRIINRAELQRSQYSKVYGYAVASIIFFHFMINVGMTIGLAPVIGIPLPFLSYGGSSLWAFTLLLFVFIRQDMHRLEVIG